jgi:hypothetical protein
LRREIGIGLGAKAFELAKGVAVGAVERVEAALEAAEPFGDALEGARER